MNKIKLKTVLSVKTMVEKGGHSFNICFLPLPHTLMHQVCVVLKILQPEKVFSNTPWLCA